MAEIHGLAARVTLLVAILIAAWSIGLAIARRPIPTLLQGGLVWAVVLIAVSGLLGVLVALVARPPADPLHVVYGLLALAVLPGAWGIARHGSDARRPVIVLVIAAIVLLVLLFRLFQTGG